MIEIKKFTLSDEEFNKLRRLVFDAAGISLSDAKRELVISRFSRRLRALNLSTFGEYYNFVISPDGQSEMQNFVNSITTNKTDFFREPHHFDFLRDHFVPECLRLGRREVRVWSAGCSTGEEPYSAAMTLHTHLTEPHGIRVKVLATDIDTSVLDAARNGIYDERQIKPIPEEMLRKYFLRGKEDSAGLYKVKDVLREIVTFRQLNFIAENYPISAVFDAVFCRNVIIYFSAETKKRVLTRLSSYLTRGGYFIIGHSETLFDMVDGLTYLKNTIYRKD